MRKYLLVIMAVVIVTSGIVLNVINSNLKEKRVLLNNNDSIQSSYDSSDWLDFNSQGVNLTSGYYKLTGDYYFDQQKIVNMSSEENLYIDLNGYKLTYGGWANWETNTTPPKYQGTVNAAFYGLKGNLYIVNSKENKQKLELDFSIAEGFDSLTLDNVDYQANVWRPAIKITGKVNIINSTVHDINHCGVETINTRQLYVTNSELNIERIINGDIIEINNSKIHFFAPEAHMMDCKQNSKLLVKDSTITGDGPNFGIARNGYSLQLDAKIINSEIRIALNKELNNNNTEAFRTNTLVVDNSKLDFPRFTVGSSLIITDSNINFLATDAFAIMPYAANTTTISNSKLSLSNSKFYSYRNGDLKVHDTTFTTNEKKWVIGVIAKNIYFDNVTGDFSQFQSVEDMTILNSNLNMKSTSTFSFIAGERAHITIDNSSILSAPTAVFNTNKPLGDIDIKNSYIEGGTEVVTTGPSIALGKVRITDSTLKNITGIHALNKDTESLVIDNSNISLLPVYGSAIVGGGYNSRAKITNSKITGENSALIAEFQGVEFKNNEVDLKNTRNQQLPLIKIGFDNPVLDTVIEDSNIKTGGSLLWANARYGASSKLTVNNVDYYTTRADPSSIEALGMDVVINDSKLLDDGNKTNSSAGIASKTLEMNNTTYSGQYILVGSGGDKDLTIDNSKITIIDNSGGAKPAVYYQNSNKDVIITNSEIIKKSSAIEGNYSLVTAEKGIIIKNGIILNEKLEKVTTDIAGIYAKGNITLDSVTYNGGRFNGQSIDISNSNMHFYTYNSPGIVAQNKLELKKSNAELTSNSLDVGIANTEDLRVIDSNIKTNTNIAVYNGYFDGKITLISKGDFSVYGNNTLRFRFGPNFELQKTTGVFSIPLEQDITLPVFHLDYDITQQEAKQKFGKFINPYHSGYRLKFNSADKCLYWAPAIVVTFVNGESREEFIFFNSERVTHDDLRDIFEDEKSSFFVEWNTNENGSGEKFISDSILEEDKVYYAVWNVVNNSCYSCNNEYKWGNLNTLDHSCQLDSTKNNKVMCLNSNSGSNGSEIEIENPKTGIREICLAILVLPFIGICIIILLKKYQPFKKI